MSSNRLAHAPSLDDRLRMRERPERRPMMYQSWRDLLFFHWRVDPHRIQRTLPPGLYVDTYDGSAWVGVVPFFMRNVRLRGTPAMPWLSNFMELNIRTYAYDSTGTPGVWFYSLDCNQPLAVWGARRFFHLPYRHARMKSQQSTDGAIEYRSTVGGRPSNARYRLGDKPARATPGSLEFFLIERYALFSASPRGKIFRGRVAHDPYQLVESTRVSWSSDLLRDHDFDVDESRPDLVHASPGVDVEVFGLQSLDANR